MGVVDSKTLAAARKYTDKSIAGGGAIKGKNCTIDSISPITGGNRVTFKWTLDDGTVQTGTMNVLDGSDGEQGPAGEQGPQGIQGPAGADGLGIKSVDINENNHLIITYDDDTTHDAGEIPGGGGTGEVISVNGKKGAVKLYATDIPMSNAAGAQTIALEISHLQGSLLNKVDKVAGKGLSTNDFSNIDKAKLDALLGIKSAGSGLNFNSETGELTATGASIDIDTELDTTSINPVQNRAIAIPIEALQGSVLSLRTALSGKQDTISDLATIRSGASAGATAYQKPNTGVPKTDLASDVQKSLGKADTALQQHQDISGKADKVSSATNGDLAGLDSNGNLTDSGVKPSDFLVGSITPTPAATITDVALKAAINGAASSENKAASAYAMKKWSNVLTKRYIVEGTSDPSTSPIGETGIGTWDDSDAPDETDWIEISDLIGIENSDDIDVKLKYDPKSGEAITLGGYIIDTDTGKMCIKFGNTIATPANARVAINIAFMRNEFSVI